MRENFSSVTHCIRACVPKMTAEGGAIVNITSIEAHRAAPGYAVYSAMKAALVNLSMTLALELGDRRIRVNCVAPDVIPTPGIGGDLPIKTPLPYAGHVDDVAAAVVASAGRFVTGSTIRRRRQPRGRGLGWGAPASETRRTARVTQARCDTVNFGWRSAHSTSLYEDATLGEQPVRVSVAPAPRYSPVRWAARLTR
jgi:hypothetical protein